MSALTAGHRWMLRCGLAGARCLACVPKENVVGRLSWRSLLFAGLPGPL